MDQTQITYGAYAFHERSAALFGLDRQFEGAPDGKPDAVTCAFTVIARFHEEDFASVEHEIAALRTALDTPEGMLRIVDENGTELHNLKVRVVSDSVPVDWRQYRGEVTVKFVGRDVSLAAAAAAATFTPTGGAAITLAGIASWAETIATDRHSTQAADRREAKLNVVAAGVVRADPGQEESVRRAYLIAEKAKIQAANAARDGVLVFGGETRTMQVENIAAALVGDGSDRLEWSMTLFRKQFPGAEYAEAKFDVRSATNHETREVTVTVSGTVRADTEVEARNKAVSIRDHYAATYALTSEETGSSRNSGADNAGAMPGTFFELSFSYQYRDAVASDIINWEWRVDTKTDQRTGLQRIAYTGRVVAATASAALAKARELGQGKHPFAVSSSEQLAYRKMGNEEERFIECTFAYEYEARGTAIFAEVTLEIKRDRFGADTMTVSGYAAAATESAAAAIGRGFKQSARLILSETETAGSEHRTVDGVTTTLFQRFNFAYSYLIDHGHSAIEYGRTEANRYEQGEQQITYDGIARAASEAQCRALVDAVVVAPAGGVRVDDGFTASYKQESGRQVLEGYRFGVTFTAQIPAGSMPASIVEAEYTVSYTLSAQKTVITPVVYGTPNVQTGVGTIPGRAQVSGTVTGFNAGAVKSWGRSKASALPGGGYTEPTQESLTMVSRRFAADTVQLYRFTFTYSAQYAQLSVA